jgi:hypothetical protein
VQRPHQPPLEGLLGGEDLGGVHPLQRLLEADDARQEPGRGRLGDDAQTAEDEPDAGLGGGQPDVHRQRHGRADADGGTVDRRDHRLGQLVDGERDLAAGVAHPALERLLGEVVAQVFGRGVDALVEAEHVALRREVHAGAEGAAGAGDDDGADGVVGRIGAEELLELASHGDGERVQRVGPVEGEDGDPVVVEGPAERLVPTHVSRSRPAVRSACTAAWGCRRSSRS